MIVIKWIDGDIPTQLHHFQNPIETVVTWTKTYVVDSWIGYDYESLLDVKELTLFVYILHVLCAQLQFVKETCCQHFVVASFLNFALNSFSLYQKQNEVLCVEKKNCQLMEFNL